MGTLNEFFAETPLPAYIFISNLVANLLSSLLLVNTWPGKLGLPSLQFLKTLLSYSLPLMVVGLSGMVNEVIDRILLKELLPLNSEEAKVQVGIYGAVYKIATLMTILTQTFRMGAEPFFFEQANSQNAKHIYARLLEYFLFVSTSFFVVVIVFLDHPEASFQKFTISRWMIGLNFPSYYEGLNVVAILFLANILFGVYYNLSVWYKLSDKTHYAAAISIGGALITIFGNIIMIPKYGYLGSAWTTLVCFAAMTLTSYFLGQRHFKIPYRSFRLVAVLLISILTIYLHEQLFSELSVSSIWKIFMIKALFCILFSMFAFIYLKLYKVVILTKT